MEASLKERGNAPVVRRLIKMRFINNKIMNNY